jgi:hypothetical protein
MTDPRSANLLPGLGASPHAMSEGERLVGYGFRGWIGGLRDGDLDRLSLVFDDYQTTLGTRGAERVLDKLAAWVRVINRTAARPIDVRPMSCKRFCRDECMAVAIVAAAQYETCPAMRACAFTLLGTSEVNGMLGCAEALAGALKEEGVRLGGAETAVADETFAPLLFDEAPAWTANRVQ